MEKLNLITNDIDEALNKASGLRTELFDLIIQDMEKLVTGNLENDFEVGVSEGIKIIENAEKRSEIIFGGFKMNGLDMSKLTEALDKNPDINKLQVKNGRGWKKESLNFDSGSVEINIISAGQGEEVKESIRKMSISALYESIDELLDEIFEKAEELQSRPEYANDEFHNGINHVYEYVYEVYQRLEEINNTLN